MEKWMSIVNFFGAFIDASIVIMLLACAGWCLWAIFNLSTVM